MPANNSRRTSGLTSLWTAAGFFYNMIAIKLSACVQTVNHQLF
jgi:hypothetical protein